MAPLQKPGVGGYRARGVYCRRLAHVANTALLNRRPGDLCGALLHPESQEDRAAAPAGHRLEAGELDAERLRNLKKASPLGRILAAGLGNAYHGRDVMKESIQEAAGHVIHDLERYLNTLGTIAAVSPLLGLLGTVFGMITVFAEIMAQGTGNASALAGGISQALITTAAGLTVAIPALVMHRYFVGRIDGIVVELEQETIKLVDALHSEENTEAQA
jgi:biopolymer transport protein ExbB